MGSIQNALEPVANISTKKKKNKKKKKKNAELLTYAQKFSLEKFSSISTNQKFLQGTTFHQNRKFPLINSNNFILKRLRGGYTKLCLQTFHHTDCMYWYLVCTESVTKVKNQELNFLASSSSQFFLLQNISAFQHNRFREYQQKFCRFWPLRGWIGSWLWVNPLKKGIFVTNFFFSDNVEWSPQKF